MRQLDNVTMICVDCFNYGGAISAIMKSLKEVRPERTVFLTDMEMTNPFFEVVQIPSIKNKEAYSRFIVKELYKYFDTTHVLIIQWDAWVLDPEQWSLDFLDYDYLGSPWNYSDDYSVGNGGFSLRSQRLMQTLAETPEIHITHPEDEITVRLYGQFLRNKGFSFAEREVADRFAYEMVGPQRPTFGFHQFYHESFKKPIILKRSGALGDIILLEPVIEWFNKKGLRVYLDIPDYLMVLFRFLPYRVYHVSELKILADGIDFDMAYEKKPMQLILKSYYENAGIEDAPLRNSQLNCRIAIESRLFRRYAVIHINYTDMPYRNIYGVEWNTIYHSLRAEGYEVVQIGDDREKCGTWVNTQDIQTLMYVIGGADLFIGSDSGPSHIAIACGVPSVLFFGSVDPSYRIANLDGVKILQGECRRSGCYHEKIGIRGTDCVIGDTTPRCSVHSTDKVWAAIDETINSHLRVDWEKMQITFDGVYGNDRVYLDVMESLCGQHRESMIDLGCNLAPYTPLLNFEKRKYVDIIPRTLDHAREQKYFEQGDILKVQIDTHYQTSIASDIIEHLTESDGVRLVDRMMRISSRQILFTPLDDTFGFDYETDNPESHRSLWKPENFAGFANIVFPDYHPTLNAGAFFVWRCIALKPIDFHRVVQELKHKSKSWTIH